MISLTLSAAMIQLHKIYIENFKGVYNPAVIDFDRRQLTILNGPNGFGKTTIFDVVELCLRGKLQRTMTYNDVTKKNADHRKPFYQHKREQDVLLKIWLKDEDRNHVIVKRLAKDNDGRIGNSKAFRPDAWGLLETYYSDDSSNFDGRPDFAASEQVDQDFIDRLFFEDLQLSLTNLFPLFNYLQQEDNIYFLKKDEDAKKNELTFLFQTQKEETDLAHLADVHNLVTSIKETLAGRISQLGQASQAGNNSAYQRLLPNKNLGFDAEDPFLAIPVDQLNTVYESFLSSVKELLEFVRAFDPVEYEKQKLKNQLRAVADNPRLLQSVILKHFLSEENAAPLRQRVERNAQYRNYREQLTNFNLNEDIVTALGFDNLFLEAFREATGRRLRLIQQIGDIGRIIRELNTSRDRTMVLFVDLHARQPQPDNCPLCNAEWESLSALDDAYNLKTQSLNSYNRVQQTELDELEQFIRQTYLGRIIDAIDGHLTLPANIIDPDFYYQVNERRGNLEAIRRFMVILETNQIDVSALLISQPVSIGRFNEQVDLLLDRLQNVVSEITIDESRLVNAGLFAQYFDENAQNLLTADQVLQKQTYLNEQFNNTKHFSLNILNDRLSKIEALERRIGSVQSQFGGAIKEYKRMMIEKIKIPFYIYSGKILQHYQQGYGIFVDVKETTSRVRFLTDESTDHDIIHQLSSGQLAVVSIAFCLALNKVYEAPKHFKFLAIDDPVQTLDDLNIHSFIELLRHEFPDYQMIISTHEEHIANYLTYKFEKFQFRCGRLNVQQTFYNSQAGLT
jgi:exonuclease SbcC